MIQGELIYKNINFNYELEEGILILKPREEFCSKMYATFYTKTLNGYTNKNDNYCEEKYLTGTIKNSFRKIFMIIASSNIDLNFFNQYLTIRVSYFLILDSSEKIAKMSFCGPELNYIYDSSQIMERIPKDDIGRIGFYLKSTDSTKSKEIIFKYRRRIIKCMFYVSGKIDYKNRESPANIMSNMVFSFTPTSNYKMIAELFEIAEDFIQFCCNRKNIKIDETKLYKLNEDKLYQLVGTLNIANDIYKYENHNNSKVYEKCISYNLIKDGIDKIFSDIAQKTLYCRHLPFSYEESKQENESTFILTSAGFEWEFKKLYPNEIPHSKSTISAQNSVSNKLDEVIQVSNAKEKKILKHLKNFICLNSLGNKIEYTCTELNKVINIFGNHLYKVLNNEEFNYVDIAERLNTQRNNFAHGNLDKDFIGSALLDLIFLRQIIYCMQLKYADISDINIQMCINKMFHMNTIQIKEI